MQYVIAIVGLAAVCVLWGLVKLWTGGDGLERAGGRSCSACGERESCEDWKAAHRRKMTAPPERRC